MSSTPRSSLKKRPGNHDDRRVSFASPLSSDKVVSPPGKKQLPIAKNAKSNHPLIKKTKATDEVTDLISIVNQQSEMIEEVFETENKFSKQSALAQDLTVELTNFIELIANLSSHQTMVKSRLEEQSMKLCTLETNIRDLVTEAHSVCTKFEARKTVRSQYAVGLLELQAALGTINCKNIGDPREPIADYDKVLDMVDKLETLVGSF